MSKIEAPDNRAIRRSPAKVRLARAMVAAAATVLASLFGPPGHAAEQNVTCVGTATETITPGLTFTPQTVHITTNLIYSPCESSDPNITAATSGSSFDAPGASCLMLPFSDSGSFTLFWNDGSTSTFAYNGETTVVGGHVVLTRIGTITAGRFAGGAAVRAVTYPAPNPLECATTGVTSQFGVVTLSITTP